MFNIKIETYNPTTSTWSQFDLITTTREGYSLVMAHAARKEASTSSPGNLRITVLPAGEDHDGDVYEDMNELQLDLDANW